MGDYVIINGVSFSDEELVASEKKFMKKHNDIYISDEQVEILKKYNINIENYKNVSELIYDIEECLNDSYTELDDLEWVSQTLSEYNYYNNTNK